MDKPAGHIVAMSDGKQTVSGPDGENESRGAIPRREGAAELSLPISIDAFGTEYGTIDIDGERTPSANRRARGADSRDSRAVARDRFARQGNAQLRSTGACWCTCPRLPSPFPFRSAPFLQRVPGRLRAGRFRFVSPNGAGNGSGDVGNWGAGASGTVESACTCRHGALCGQRRDTAAPRPGRSRQAACCKRQPGADGARSAQASARGRDRSAANRAGTEPPRARSGREDGPIGGPSGAGRSTPEAKDARMPRTAPCRDAAHEPCAAPVAARLVPRPGLHPAFALQRAVGNAAVAARLQAVAVQRECR